MPELHEQVRLAIEKALHDFTALEVLAKDKTIADEIVGFHAQQTIEKALKAVLVYRKIVYRKTHDIAELLDLLKDNGMVIPEKIEQAVALTPFAVEYRYDFLPSDGEYEPFDRIFALGLASNCIVWAKQNTGIE